MKIFLTRFIAEDHGHFDSLAGKKEISGPKSQLGS
jgi:hypothetical protein